MIGTIVYLSTNNYGDDGGGDDDDGVKIMMVVVMMVFVNRVGQASMEHYLYHLRAMQKQLDCFLLTLFNCGQKQQSATQQSATQTLCHPKSTK